MGWIAPGGAGGGEGEGATHERSGSDERFAGGEAAGPGAGGPSVLLSDFFWHAEFLILVQSALGGGTGGVPGSRNHWG